MKSKKFTYFLLIMVILVWANIVYQFVTPSNESQILRSNVESSIESKIEFTHPNQNLMLNYRDPFLENSRTIKKKNYSKASMQPIKKSLTTKLNWPKVEYSGSISSSATKNKMAMIKINGKEHIMKEGELKDGIEVEHIYHDSVTLAYMNTAKTILK